MLTTEVIVLCTSCVVEHICPGLLKPKQPHSLASVATVNDHTVPSHPGAREALVQLERIERVALTPRHCRETALHPQYPQVDQGSSTGVLQL